VEKVVWEAIGVEIRIIIQVFVWVFRCGGTRLCMRWMKIEFLIIITLFPFSMQAKSEMFFIWRLAGGIKDAESAKIP
jgi:hypothetical protein